MLQMVTRKIEVAIWGRTENVSQYMQESVPLHFRDLLTRINKNLSKLRRQKAPEKPSNYYLHRLSFYTQYTRFTQHKLNPHSEQKHV